MRRQGCVGRLVGQIVANMGKKCPLGLCPIDDAQRILYCRVRRVRLVPERIQKENIQSLELTKRRLRNFTVVREIGSFSKAKSIDLDLAVNQTYRFELRAKNFHRAIDRPQLQ